VEVLSEAYRVLKEGGELILSCDALETITDPSLIEQHRSKHFVVHYFRAHELAVLLERAGFVDISIEPLFRSAEATALFRQGIATQFNFGWRAPLVYRKLVRSERVVCRDSHSLFLMAFCRKARMPYRSDTARPELPVSHHA
jgi:hypothetical protein